MTFCNVTLSFEKAGQSYILSFKKENNVSFSFHQEIFQTYQMLVGFVKAFIILKDGDMLYMTSIPAINISEVSPTLSTWLLWCLR
jgi:hypothetical protein